MRRQMGTHRIGGEGGGGDADVIHVAATGNGDSRGGAGVGDVPQHDPYQTCSIKSAG